MVITQDVTENYAIYNGDCCEVLPKLKTGSIDFSIYSPPFCGLYNYSSSERDMSNCKTYDDFFAHYEFLVSEIARLTKPGRISAVHCCDIPKNGANICGYTDFPGDVVRLHEKHGFEMLPRFCIWKEPLGVRNRTMAKSLAHKTIVEDSTLCNCAAADYLIPFRKKGENKVPVTHPTGIHEYHGERIIPHELQQYKGWTGKQTENRFSHWIWRQYASCFWDDIRIDEVLDFEQARDEQDERHPHPLQLDVIARCVELFTNPREIVLTPFMGVGSEVYQPVKMGRRAIGVELKPSYYRQAVMNLKKLTEKQHEQNELIRLEQPAVTESVM